MIDQRSVRNEARERKIVSPNGGDTISTTWFEVEGGGEEEMVVAAGGVPDLVGPCRRERLLIVWLSSFLWPELNTVGKFFGPFYASPDVR